MNTPWIHRQRDRWHTFSPLRQRLLVALAVFIVLLVIARVALPIVLRHIINDRLANLAPYSGHVGDVDLALWRGAYAMSDLTLTIQRPDAPEPDPVLLVDTVDITIMWGELLRGQLVGDIIVTRPELFLTPQLANQGEEPPTAHDGQSSPSGPDSEPRQWQDYVRQLSLMHIDRIDIREGVLWYRDDEHAVEQVRLATIGARLDGLAVNSQVKGHEALLTVTGQTIGGGTLTVAGRADALAELPTFSAQAAVESMSCPELNPLTKRFDNLTFDAGTFSCFIEVDAANGRIDGFLKPIFVDLSVASFKDDSGSAASNLFWNALVPVAEFLLENSEEDQHAARIPIDGEIESPETDVWVLVTSTLRNAFIQAIIPGFAER